MKILLAVDGSPCSNQAIEEVARRPWPAASEIKVMTAYELPLPPVSETLTMPPTYLEQLDRAVSEQARSIVERAVTSLRSSMDSAVNIQGETIPGPARAVILDEAASWGANLIVVGSHGYRAWERFLLGSVSQSIVSHAKCSVEVVRCPANGKAEQEPATAKEEGR